MLMFTLAISCLTTSNLPWFMVLYSVPLTPQQTTINPLCQWRLLGTHRKVWFSLLWGHWSFILGPGVHKVLFVPLKSLFPQSCGSSVIKSYWPSESNSLDILNPFARSPCWEICCGPKNFCTVWKLLWYNCSPVCRSSSWWLFGGAHTWCLPGLLHPEPLSL